MINEANLRKKIQENKYFERKNADGLLVFTHGYRSSPVNFIDLIVDLINDEEGQLTNCDLLPYCYKASALSNTNLENEAKKLQSQIQHHYESKKYKRIYLVGHSLGGILIRKTVLEGYRDITNKPMEKHWVSSLTRLVLLAATNRGIIIQSTMHKWAYSISRMFGCAKLIRDGQRGSQFMNSLRLGWITTFQRRDREAPEIFQVLGDEDDTVGRYDSIDLQRFPNSAEIVLEGIGHSDFKGMTSAHPCYERIRMSFSQPINDLETSLIQTDSETDALYFLIHGIRDFGEWQSTLGHAIQSENANAKVISVRYGYFNIFQFLLGFQRGRAVRAFTDRYIEEIANLNRNIDEVNIGVAAHSNGTYVLANALSLYPEMIMHRIYFAGSVLPDTAWEKLSKEQKKNIKIIRNDCANWDWPVGILCSGLRWIFLFKSLGVSGYKGFKKQNGMLKIYNNMYLDGGHSAAFAPHLHSDIAKFLCTGAPKKLRVIRDSKGIMNILFTLGPVILLFIFYGIYKVYSSVIPSLYYNVLPYIPALSMDLFYIFASAIFTVFIVLVLVRI